VANFLRHMLRGRGARAAWSSGLVRPGQRTDLQRLIVTAAYYSFSSSRPSMGILRKSRGSWVAYSSVVMSACLTIMCCSSATRFTSGLQQSRHVISCMNGCMRRKRGAHGGRSSRPRSARLEAVGMPQPKQRIARGGPGGASQVVPSLQQASPAFVAMSIFPCRCVRMTRQLLFGLVCPWSLKCGLLT